MRFIWKVFATKILLSGKFSLFLTLNTLHHFYPQLITYAVVLFKIDGELGDHDRVLHVHLYPLQALDALLAGVPCHGQLVNPNGQMQL